MSLIGLLNYFDQKRGQEQYGNLLNEYRVPGDPNTENPGPYALGSPEMNQALLQRHGGFRGEGGVLSGGPPQEFYMRAAALPGYQQLAQQAQIGQQAMERQAASQQWQEQNLTYGQRAELDVRKEEQKWKREREEMAWNTKAGMTNYQAEQLALAKQAQARLAAGAGGGGGAQPGGVVFGAPPSGYSMSIDPVTNQPMLQPMVGGKDWTEQTQNVQKLNASVGALDDMINFVKEKGAFETGAKSGQISAGQRQTVIAGLSALNNMGVLQPGELEYLQEQVGDPNAWGSIFKNSNTVIGKLQGVRERFIKASKDAYSRSQGSASAPPPPAGFTRAQ